MINDDFTKANIRQPLTAAQVAGILGFADYGDDCDESGVYIADELLSGKIAFKDAEVEAIADYLGLSVLELAAFDCRFDSWKMSSVD